MGVLAAFLLSGYLIAQVWGALANTYDPLEQSSKREGEATLEKPFTILLLGTDARKVTTNWRADVIILATVNPKKKSVKMVSIPRDTYVKIANTDKMDKINSAPYYGRKSVNPKGPGPIANTAQTVEDLLHVPVDYYVKVNFQGFIDVVDALGGVNVNVKFPFSQEHFGGEVIPFKPGPKLLNGNEALAYVRMRKQDPRGDLGRNERQREVMTNLLDRAMSLNTVTKIDDLLDAVGQNMKLGIKVQDLPKLQSIYQDIPKESIQNMKLKGENKRLEYWYYIVSNQERQRMSNILRKHLELDSKPIDQWDVPTADQESGTPSGNQGGMNGTESP
ncbi:transcriptional attenuator, LytR family [Melghirimyces thermohalophilus]|uniref:Transcriptional attenuator, LytR family n=2 Tax=Melghirimyces thermohalophilus TaxID=1236220 RepID=A0A1G6QNR7_9BACL|nr:transcriptional attenuator, LytR family [Melghirimyces thermohalophilus]